MAFSAARQSGWHSESERPGISGTHTLYERMEKRPFVGSNIRKTESTYNAEAKAMDWTIRLQEKVWNGYTLVVSYDNQFEHDRATLNSVARTLGPNARPVPRSHRRRQSQTQSKIRTNQLNRIVPPTSAKPTAD